MKIITILLTLILLTSCQEFKQNEISDITFEIGDVVQVIRKDDPHDINSGTVNHITENNITIGNIIYEFEQLNEKYIVTLMYENE